MKKIINLLLVLFPIMSIGQTALPTTIVKGVGYAGITTDQLVASQSIILKPGVVIQAGSTFSAKIVSNNFTGTDFNTPVTNGNSGPTALRGENYIYNRKFNTPMKTPAGIIKNSDVTESITYYDGLGRPKQQIAIKASPNEQDIVTHIEYDAFGRQSKDYLPYPSTQNTGVYIDGTIAKPATLGYYQSKYNEGNPFSDKQLEASPLNRVLKQAAPGNDWALGNGHEIKLDYQTNTAIDGVKLFSVTTNWDTAKELYDIPTALTPANYLDFQLYKTITYDENTAANPSESNGSTVEFKNKEGQVVLKRTYDSNTTHDTYYIYDQFGNLTFVLPPLVNASSTITQTILDGLCYQYKYDHRNRLVEKKLPGKQWEFIVYDKLDRPVATGPAYSPFGDGTSGWMITKYDVFSRPVYTGWHTATVTATTRFSLQNNQNNLTTTLNETKTGSGTIDGVSAYYSNAVAPTNVKLLTVNYYDDYNFPNAPSPVPASVLSDNSQAVYYNTTQKPIGLPTGSWVRVLQNPTDTSGESSYILYDAKARPVRTFTKNYFGSSAGYTYTDSKIDFAGKVLLSETKHKRLSTDAEIKTTEVFTYSPQNRLLSHTHQINANTPQLLAENTYDELGQLTSKKVGNNSTNPLQKVDYGYNIRGWLTGINNDPTNNLVLNTTEKDLFAFKINYNTTAGNVSSVKSLYNGNISETYYKTGADNVLRKYGYVYDNLNRLKNAIFQKPGGNTYPTYEDYSEKNITYDKNGNLQTLYRNGDVVDALPANQIDNLQYYYKLNSNILTSVTDNSGNTSGFYDGNIVGVDYDYDANGNMTVDRNKNITTITYNHLNLPIKITFGIKGNISYIYNASGQKIAKIVNSLLPTLAVTITDYLGGFQYQKVNTAAIGLQFFPTAEGYVKNIAGVLSYVYNYTDHLGNVRVSYQDLNRNGTIDTSEILEENNYYPFGLKHKGYNSNNAQPNYKYKYQGQERQDELGLNWDSFKWRNYDFAIGRFMSIDPLTEEYHTWSPYVFSGNRVVDSRELEGLEPYTVTGRAFIPLPKVDSPLASVSNTASFKGDTRNNYDVNSTSFRTEQKVRVDFENKTATTLSNVASPTVGFDSKGNITETSKAGVAGPTPTYDKSALDKGNTTTINMQVDASNKLIDGAPAINYDVNISLTPQGNGSVDYKINGKSDGFPAYEFFLTNEATGKSTLMFGSNPNKSGDTPRALFPPMEKSFLGTGTLENKKVEEKK